MRRGDGQRRRDDRQPRQRRHNAFHNATPQAIIRALSKQEPRRLDSVISYEAHTQNQMWRTLRYKHPNLFLDDHQIKLTQTMLKETFTPGQPFRPIHERTRHANAQVLLNMFTQAILRDCIEVHLMKLRGSDKGRMSSQLLGGVSGKMLYTQLSSMHARLSGKMVALPLGADSILRHASIDGSVEMTDQVWRAVLGVDDINNPKYTDARRLVLTVMQCVRFMHAYYAPWVLGDRLAAKFGAGLEEHYQAFLTNLYDAERRAPLFDNNLDWADAVIKVPVPSIEEQYELICADLPRATPLLD